MKKQTPDIFQVSRIVFVVTLQLASISIFAQSLTPKEWEAIQKSNNYLIGLGVSTSIDEARQAALSDLAGKISTKVQSQFDYTLKNENKNGQVNSEERLKNVVRSYSSVTLKNVSEYMVRDKNEYIVYRYMKNSEMRAMFKRRIELAKKWAKEGVDREKEGRIGDALQSFYWSLALLNSCPDADLETISQDYVEVNMNQDVFRRVKDILNEISIKAISVDKEDYHQYVTLSVLYRGKPAVNFNYKYFDGKQYSSVYTAKNGEGEIVLPLSTNLKRLRVTAEYECRDEANIHPDVKSVMEFTDPASFKNADFIVDTKGVATLNSTSYAIQNIETSPAIEAQNITGVSEQTVSPFLATMQTVEKGISQRDLQSIRNCFTAEGWKMFDALIHYGNAKLLRAPDVQFLPDGDGAVCRSFPMSFSFKGNRRTFVEDVVFYLDGQAKIREIAFGLEKAALDDIMNRGLWKQEERQVMVHFLETYKTAYALKRLDYLNAIFSSDALIITGSIVKGTGQKEMQPAKMSHVRYTRQTKEQYMANLKKCFDGNEYVNIHFGDNIIRRSNTKTNIYGIQIKQDYFSSTYGDTGYLFLMIDFKTPAEPIIHVRTWQPDLDPNVKDGRIGMADFNI